MTDEPDCEYCEEGQCHGAMCPSDEECTCEPLYESGIYWIDNAYNVVRKLRQESGQHAVRPLLSRVRVRDEAAPTRL